MTEPGLALWVSARLSLRDGRTVSLSLCSRTHSDAVTQSTTHTPSPRTLTAHTCSCSRTHPHSHLGRLSRTFTPLVGNTAVCCGAHSA